MIDGHKVIEVVPCFAPAEMFEESRTYLADKWTPGLVDERWLLLNKYPLPSVEENERALRILAERFGYLVFDSGADLGLGRSVTKFLVDIPQPPGTLMISVDPDSITHDRGFDKAMCDVVLSGSGLPACVLGIPQTKEAPSTLIAGYRVYIHPSVMMTNIGCLDLDWHGTDFIANEKLWGGNESKLHSRLAATGTHLAYLLDYNNASDIRSHHDLRYAIWKWEHFYGRFEGSFAEYLRSQKCVTDILDRCTRQAGVLSLVKDLLCSLETGTDSSLLIQQVHRELYGLGEY